MAYLFCKSHIEKGKQFVLEKRDAELKNVKVKNKVVAQPKCKDKSIKANMKKCDNPETTPLKDAIMTDNVVMPSKR